MADAEGAAEGEPRQPHKAFGGSEQFVLRYFGQATVLLRGDALIFTLLISQYIKRSANKVYFIIIFNYFDFFFLKLQH